MPRTAAAVGMLVATMTSRLLTRFGFYRTQVRLMLAFLCIFIYGLDGQVVCPL